MSAAASFDALPSVAELRDRIATLVDDIRAEGGTDVELVAVTKSQPAALARRVVEAGVVDLGENVAQELVAKATEVPGARWHAIGRLQRNKVRRLAPFVALWQSVDRLELGVEVARWAPGAAVLVQVNATGEAQKGGCAPGAVEGLVGSLRAEGLDVRGLMTIGVAGDAARTLAAFDHVVALADELSLPIRSMGMSDDWRLAVHAGATLLRVGRALVGERSDVRADPRPGQRSVGD